MGPKLASSRMLKTIVQGQLCLLGRSEEIWFGEPLGVRIGLFEPTLETK